MAGFVIVSGPPASGKTRLAEYLGRELGVPVISKDAIKERLMDRVGSGSEVGEATFDVQFAVARELLRAGTRFILEGAFFRNQGPLRELASKGAAVVIEVECDVDELERRYAARQQTGGRHPGHRGLEALPDLRRRVIEGEYGVPDLGRPVLRVDTTHGQRPTDADVAAWVRAQLGGVVQPQALTSRSLRDAWDEQAEAWTRWAREPGHDTYWRFARDAFLPLVPPPGQLTLDLGCGEGRVSRDLVTAGHHVVALDGSPGMARAALGAAPAVPVMVASAERLPFAGASFDLVVAYMTLHDFDDMEGAMKEVARVLQPGGRLCAGVVHPINSAGDFTAADDDADFVIQRSYFDRRPYVDRIERNGLQMTFSSRHHTLEDYVEGLVLAGFEVEGLREVTSPEGHWTRVPMFLFLRAVKR